jgi:hypothetical protein
MSALAKILGTYAPGHSLSHAGKEYVFSRVSQKTKDLRADLSEEQFDRHLSRVTDAYTRGQYGWPLGESFGYYLQAGLPELARHLTGCTQQEAEALCEERSVEVMHLCLCVIMESQPSLKKTVLSQPDGPQAQALLTLLSATAQSDSPSSAPTRPPPSPNVESTPTCTPS